MINLATGALLKAATSLSAAAASTALVATPALAIPVQDAPQAPATASAATVQLADLPAFDPRFRVFRAHFRTYGECVFFANHDGKPRTNGWDCRRGGDRNFPWEYWY